MKAEEKRVQLVVEIEQDEDGYPGVGAERLWCMRRGERFEVDNIPFFVCGLACGDLVTASRVDGVLQLDRVVQASGHATVWLYCSSVDVRDDLRTRLGELGCSSEVSHLPLYVAVDVPLGVERTELRRLLDAGEQQDKWEWAEGLPL